MSEPLHDIDKLFHDSIEGHSEYPPLKVWDKIEAGLDKDMAVTYKKKYKTLKRAAAILLILFLGVILYMVINRQPGQQDVAGTEKETNEQGNIKTKPDDKVTNTQGTEKNETANQLPNEDNGSTNKQNKSIIEEKKDVSRTQSPVILPVDVDPLTDPAKELVNTIPDNRNSKKEIKEKHSIPKQKGKNKPANADNIVFDTEASGKSKSGNEKFNSNIPVVSSVTQNNNSPGDEKVKRSFSFTMTQADGSWKKDMSTGIRPSVPASGQMPLVYAKVKKGRYPGLGKPGLSLSVYFSPDATWNNIEDDKPHRSGGGGSGGGGRIEDHHEIKRNENESTAYSAGIKLSYGLSKKISLQSGLNYTKTFSAIKPKLIYADKDNNGNVRYRLDCSSGYTFLLPHSSSAPSAGDSLLASDSKNSLSYIGIPLTVEYRFSFGRFSIAASAGGQVNFLQKGKTSAVFEKGTVNETSASSNTQGLRPTYFSALTGITGEFKLNKKLSLMIAPSGQFGLSSINSGASVKTRSNYFGVAAGLKLKL